MKFYTWKDVERYFLPHRASWESAIAAVDVYPTDITVYAKPDACDRMPIMMFDTNHGRNREIQEDDGVPKEEKYYRYFQCPCHLILDKICLIQL